MIKQVAIALGALFAAITGGGSVYLATRPSLAISVCDPPNGALHRLVLFGLTDISFSCVPQLNSMCGGHLCRSFTAREGKAHIYGYVWRDSFNGLMTTFCSPDGGWPGGWDGECPEGVAIDSEKEYVRALRH